MSDTETNSLMPERSDAPACSLNQVKEGGFYYAELPKIVKGKTLRVEVDIWNAYGTEGNEITVRLTTGSLKKRFLRDEELEGAKFSANSGDQCQK